jgi:hypothetical protein
MESKRKVQGEIKGETVGLISQRPSDPNSCVAGGLPSHCAIKGRWGPAAHDTRFTAAATTPTV